MVTRYKTRIKPLKISQDPDKAAFVKHQYDIDIVEVYHRLKKKISDVSILKAGFNSEVYLLNIKTGIENYCHDNSFNFEHHWANSYLVIPSTVPYYNMALILAITSENLLRIERFLNYQAKHYEGKEPFLNLIEFKVFQRLESTSPFHDSIDRQGIVMNWIEKVSKKNERIPRPGEIKTFEGLFRNFEDAGRIILKLKEINVIDEDSIWIGHTKRKTEICVLREVLETKKYFKEINITPAVKILCAKFAIKLSERSYRSGVSISDTAYKFYDKKIPKSNIV